jgi:AraC-like DNA-binding protein
MEPGSDEKAVPCPPQTASRLPLSRLACLHTHDVDHARDVIAGAVGPHRLTIASAGEPFEARLHMMPAGDVRVSYLDHGGAVDVTAREIESFYLVPMPLAGGAEISCGREQARYDRTGAAVPPLNCEFRVRVRSGSPHLMAWIARDRLEAHLRSTLARPVTKPVRFALGMDLASRAGRGWRRTVDYLVGEIDADGALLGQPLAMREFEGLFLAQLLLAQPSNYSELLHDGKPGPVAPRAIRRAAELIQDHAAEPLTGEDVAAAVGLSVRALQDGFHRYLETTPTLYLREVRLRRVHDDLLAADPRAAKVTDIAIRWGFLQLGRFAAQYRKRFGESPSATLRR